MASPTSVCAQAPAISSPPASQSVVSGSNASFSVIASGAAPLSYQWRLFGTNLPGATNSTVVRTNVRSAVGGLYTVVVANSLGAVTSAPVLLNVDEHLTFRIVELQTNGVLAVEHGPQSGDDRNAVVVSSQSVFVTGDSATIRASASDLSGVASLGVLNDAMCSNLRTEKIYSLANGTTFITQFGGLVNALVELDPVTGAPTPNVINLSTNINVPGFGSDSVGIFSGYDRILIWPRFGDGHVYEIALPTGRVTDLGFMPFFSHRTSEGWGFWGLAEYFGNTLYLVYVENSPRIVRRAVGSAASTPVGIFSNLSDMAAISFSTSRSRWYFHHEGFSQFRSGGDETVGSAKALFSTDRGFPTIYQGPQSQTRFPGETVTFSAVVTGGEPLAYQWQMNGTNLNGATNVTLVLSNVEPTATGNYSLAVNNAAGTAVSGNGFLFVVGTPQILVPPQPVSALPGTNASFSVVVLAAPPVSFQWRHNGTNVPNATNATYDIPFVTSANAGNYHVVVTNRYGSATSSIVTLSLIIESAYSFRILSLSNDAVVAEHLALTGNDGGGIAVSSNRVFVTGDGPAFNGATAIFSAADLTGGTTLPSPYQALVTDLRNERVYSLGDRTNLFLTTTSTVVSTLIEIHGTTGARTTNIINLSQPVPVSTAGNVGLFSGYGQIVIHSGSRVYSIAVPSGVVADLGSMFVPSHQPTETWAYWGLAENFGNAVYLVYVQNPFSIVRTRVPDGITTTIANFIDLSDMASIGASVSRGRWYFHYQGESEFGGTNETVGFASARYSVVATPIVDHFTWGPLPGAQFSGVPFTATISARTIDDTVLSNFSGQVQLAGFTTLDSQPVTVLPGTTANFSNGVWTGQILVPQPVSGMLLRASDFAGRFGVSTSFGVVTTNDLAVQVVPSTNAATLYAALTYNIFVTNTGPQVSSSVFATNVLPADMNFISATASQGSCSLNSGIVVCDIGTMSSGTSVSIAITVVPNALGTLTNITRVVRSTVEEHPENNAATNMIPVSLPVITITDAAVQEGDSAATRGTNVFTVQLNTTSAVPVTVQFATAVGSASNAVDYVNRSGTLTFAPGVTTTNVRVTIVTDLSYEQDEFFLVNFSNAANAMLIRTQAIGTILNDDPAPTLVVTNTIVTEGNSGTAPVTITVQLSNPASVPISLSYATVNGTANAGSDYAARSGVLTFANGVTNASFTVNITGDTAGESNEFFFINFFNGVNLTVNTQITVAIMNNDPVTVDHFLVSNVAPTQYLNTPFFPTLVAQDFNNNTVTNFNGTVSFALGSSDVTIGLGSSIWNWPLSVFYEDARCQTIYLAGELGGPRRLTSLALNVTGLPSKPMANWIIRMKHTPLNAYSPAAFDNSGWTVVHQSNVTITQTNWVTFNFSTPFDYNGVNNLMIDFTFDDTSFSSPDGFVAATDRGTIRSAYARCDSCNGDPKLWTTSPSPNSSSLVPDIRLGGIGGAPIAPSASGVFTNGVWSGAIRALGPVENTPLIVIDSNQRFGASVPITVLLTDDLSLRVLPSANPTPVGENLVYSIIVSNSGPSASTGVFMTNQLPANATYISAATDRGTVLQTGSRVVANIGTLGSGEAALVTVAVRPNGAGTLTNSAITRRSEADPYLANNSQTNVVSVVNLALSVSNVFVREGHNGTTNLVFNVILTPVSTQTVSVAWLTRSDDSFSGASPGADFQTNTGVLVFSPGVTNRTIAVPVFGERLNEPDEFFELVLRNPTNATLSQTNAYGIIVNDDPLPMVSVSDISVTEGRDSFTAATFTLTLSQASGLPVNVFVETIDGTADELSDYEPTNIVVTFPPGAVTVPMTVFLRGDFLLENDETFFLNLGVPDNATLATAQATGVILNDEVGAGIFDRFEWSVIPSPQTTGRAINVNITARDGVNALVPFNGNVSLSARSGTNTLALAPTNTVTFSNGVWSGAVTLSSSRTNVVLTVDDGAGHTGDSNPFDVNIADVRLAGRTPPEALIESPFNYTLAVSNAAVNPATAVAVTTVLSTDAQFVSANSSAGSCSHANGIVTCNVSTLTNGGTATITIVLNPLRGGPLTNVSSVAAFEFDPVSTNNVAVNVLTITGDEDADGLPDSWEAQYGLSSSNPNDAQQDSDGDRHTNLQEYIAGTDPTNPASVLKVTAAVNTLTAQISFITVTGRRYRVETASAPAGPWTTLGNDLVGEGDVAVVFDLGVTMQTQRFYRVQVVR